MSDALPETSGSQTPENMWDHEAIHLWFNLTYANYLVAPRSVLQSMPDEWQKRFVLCLNEMQKAFGHLEWPDYEVKTLARAPEHKTIYDKCDECDGTGLARDGNAETGAECEWCKGLGEVEDSESPRYETPEEVGYRDDPIPHYNRGRTKLEAEGV